MRRLQLRLLVLMMRRFSCFLIGGDFEWWNGEDFVSSFAEVVVEEECCDYGSKEERKQRDRKWKLHDGFVRVYEMRCDAMRRAVEIPIGNFLVLNWKMARGVRSEVYCFALTLTFGWWWGWEFLLGQADEYLWLRWAAKPKSLTSETVSFGSYFG